MELERWKAVRFRTFVLYWTFVMLMSAVDSISLSGMTNLFINTMQMDQTEIYVSLSIILSPVVAIAFNPIVGRYVDRTRHVKRFIILYCVVLTISCLVYCVSLSPWFVIASRLLQGVSWPAQAIVTGETVRCYPIAETARIVSFNFMAFEIGKLMGPALYVVFPHFHAKYFKFVFTEEYMPMVLVACVLLILLLLVVCLAEDISKIYDLKQEEMSQTRDLKQPPLLFREILAIDNTPALLLMIWVAGASIFTLRYAQPIIATVLHTYTMADVGRMFILATCAFFATSFFNAFYLSQRNQNKWLLCVMLALSLALFLATWSCLDLDKTSVSVLQYAYAVLRGVGMVSDQIVAAMIVQQIPSNTQVYVESIIKSTSSSTIVVCSFLPVFLRHLPILLLAQISLILFALYWFFRKKLRGYSKMMSPD